MDFLIRIQVLFLSALSAHWLAGGLFVENQNLLIELAVIGSLLFCIRSIELEGPNLALLILFIQSSSHFILGGGTYLNESRMTMAHLLSGLLSYFVISYFDIVWDLIASALTALVPKKYFPLLSIPGPSRYPSTYSNPTFQIRQLTASLKFRGPPFAWEN